MSSRRGTKRTIIDIDPPAQDPRDLGQGERSRARRNDSTSPALTRQDHSTSSGLHRRVQDHRARELPSGGGGHAQARSGRVIQVDQLVLKIRALEAAASRHGEEIAREREANAIAQLLIAQYKAQEDEEAAQELRAQHRRNRDEDKHEDELDTLRTHNEQLRELLEEETKKSERLAHDRSKSAKNLAEAESGGRRQGAELSNREGTITTLTDKLEKVTRDSIKKSTTISELHRDFDKKAAKVEELRTQRTGLRNRLDEQASLLQTAVGERDSELDTLRALLSISSEDIAALEATANQSRDDKERLQLRYTEAGLALTAAQDELEEARIQAGANREATATMSRQIAMLVEDQELRRQEVESLRRQLVAGTSPAAPISTLMSRPTATPRSGVITLPLPDPLSFMYAGSNDRSRSSRNRDDIDDRPHRSSGSRRSRDRDDFDDRTHRSSGFECKLFCSELNAAK